MTPRTAGTRGKPKGDPGAAPTRVVLHEAALGYLARGSASAATLGRVLERRVSNWARRSARAGGDPEAIATDVETCRSSIASIVARFCEVGLLNDEAYAKSRARSLGRAGRSRRAILANLTAKGVAATTAREALPDDELGAALVFARKRRIGPFAREPIDPRDRAARQKELAAMARAGFDWSTCERALRMDRDEADERLAGSRLGD